MKPVHWICFTVFAIATEFFLVDLIKYDARMDILQRTARAIGSSYHPSRAIRPDLHHL